MRKNIIALIAVVILVGWALISEIVDQQKAPSSAQSSTPKDAIIGTQIGDEAPNFSLSDLHGKTVSLSDYKGKIVFLNFWATWCPPCKAEMPHMRKIYDDYKAEDVVILAVNLTNTERTKQAVVDFVDDYALRFPTVKDVAGDVENLFQVIVYPTTYVLDADGIITAKYMGAIHYDTMKKAIKEAR